MAKTVDSKVAVTALKEAGAIPLVPYTRSSAKWKSRCKTCQNIIYPRYSVVKKGHHPCGSCGRFFSGANRRKKLEKKRLVAEFILECITISKKNPEMSQHEIIKTAKKKWDK